MTAEILETIDTELLEEEPAGEEVTVLTADVSGERLDVCLARLLSVSRSAAANLIEGGRVTQDGRVLSKKNKTKAGDRISVLIPPPEAVEAVPQNIPLDVRYEDDDLIVINKPSGMVVHPAPGNPDGTLVNALLYHCRGSLSGIGGAIRPGIVHRIDKDTSGLLVVAKNDFTHRVLSDALKVHDVRRIYTAIAIGGFPQESGTVNAPIGRHPTDRKRMAVLRGDGVRAREAVTHWSVERRFGRFTLVRCELETGRTHQIRVHMSSIGHALMGDPVYGGESTSGGKYKSFIKGQCLFAAELRLTHPKSREEMIFKAEFPENFKGLLEQLRKDSTID